jgi:hypothetical protein
MIDLDSFGPYGFAELGEHVKTAIEKAIVLAVSYNDEVTFSFNGTRIKVGPLSRVEDVYLDYEAAHIAATNAYWESPEGVKLRAEQDLYVRECTAKMDEALQAATNIDFTDADSVLAWVISWLEPSQNIKVIYDMSAFSKLIKEGGWIANDACGLDASCYSDKKTFARWLIGQVLNCLDEELPPHPMVANFYTTYLGLKYE